MAEGVLIQAVGNDGLPLLKYAGAVLTVQDPSRTIVRDGKVSEKTYPLHLDALARATVSLVVWERLQHAMGLNGVDVFRFVAVGAVRKPPAQGVGFGGNREPDKDAYLFSRDGRIISNGKVHSNEVRK